MNRDFRRIAIVNRGDAAMRFIHPAREFSEEHGAPLCTVALYTDPDRHAMFVREADEAVYLGPPHTFDPGTGQARSNYVDYKRLEEALLAARADAVWVGWGLSPSMPDLPTCVPISGLSSWALRRGNANAR